MAAGPSHVALSELDANSAASHGRSVVLTVPSILKPESCGGRQVSCISESTGTQGFFAAIREGDIIAYLGLPSLEPFERYVVLDFPGIVGVIKNDSPWRQC
jgi:hypothetical protein